MNCLITDVIEDVIKYDTKATKIIESAKVYGSYYMFERIAYEKENKI